MNRHRDAQCRAQRECAQSTFSQVLLLTVGTSDGTSRGLSQRGGVGAFSSGIANVNVCCEFLAAIRRLSDPQRTPYLSQR
jgi:hypothetical protein